MDLESLEQSISLIQRLIDSESTIRSLTEQLQSKDQLINSLQSKLLEYTSNTQLKSYISGLESTVKSLQMKVEQLEIVLFSQQLAAQVSSIPKSSTKSLASAKSEVSFNTLLDSNYFWDCLSGFLSEEDHVKLLLSTSIDKKKVLSRVKSFDRLHEKQELYEKKEENREIRGLLKQEHYFEVSIKGIEDKLVTVMKTLLVMQKTTDILTSVSLPTEKYSSIEELILNRFTPEKTLQLLHRSASFLANNQAKMSDWVTFIDNSFSGLLYESAKLLTDSKTVEKLKKDLIEKLKAAEHHLISMEFERKELEEQLETEKNLKVHLAQRLKKIELENSKRGSDLIKLKESLQQSELEKIHNSKKLENISSEFESHRKIMSTEIFRLRNQAKISNIQKTEILEAFTEFSQILNSLSFD